MRNMVWRLLQPKRLERLLEAAKTLRMEWAFWRRGLNKCLLLYFLPRPSSLPPPAFQTPLVPPRAQSPFLTLGCVGGLSGILLLCFRTSFILSSSFFSRSPLRTRRGRAAVGRVRAATPISSLPPPLRWVGHGLLLLFFLPRPSAFQTPLVPPRAISILDSWVGGFLVWQAARQNLF